MSHLLDVNLLLACAWSGHAEHVRANRWLNSVAEFSTAPVTQMGFLRVSLSLPALSSGKDVTDAHLVRLADSQCLKLATLDGGTTCFLRSSTCDACDVISGPPGVALTVR